MTQTSVEPLLFVIFGATGDLSRRKLLPALYHLAGQGSFEHSVVLGTARTTEMDTEGFRTLVRSAIAAADTDSASVSSRWCNECVYYCPIGGGEDDFHGL